MSQGRGQRRRRRSEDFPAPEVRASNLRRHNDSKHRIRVSSNYRVAVAARCTQTSWRGAPELQGPSGSLLRSKEYTNQFIEAICPSLHDKPCTLGPLPSAQISSHPDLVSGQSNGRSPSQTSPPRQKLARFSENRGTTAPSSSRASISSSSNENAVCSPQNATNANNSHPRRHSFSDSILLPEAIPHMALKKACRSHTVFNSFFSLHSVCITSSYSGNGTRQ